MLQSQVFTSSGTFNVPASVSAVWVTGSGGGAAGEGYIGGTGSVGGAGGAAEFCEMRLIPVTPGGTLAIVIGTGGVGRTDRTASDNGVSSTYGAFNLLYGFGTIGGGSDYGPGGGPNGSALNTTSPPGKIGNAESRSYFGGTEGNTKNQTTATGTANDSDAVGAIGGGASPGNAGAGLLWAHGGNAGSANAAGGNASANSGGGGGTAGGSAANSKGGDGGSGRVEIFWS